MQDLYKLTATTLKQKLEKGEITSVDIIKSLQERNQEVGQHINGFTHTLFDEALKLAAIRDEQRKNGEILGAMHGLPITVKDNIAMEGFPLTMGVKRLENILEKEDAAIIKVMKASGAIIIGRSNVPQGLMSGMECENPVYGKTRNPWSLQHGPGGSSSGEGALLGSGESIMGIGSDLAGSVRFPASFCGVVGFKPTSKRWSSLGARSVLSNQEIVPSQVAPMARSTDDIILMMKAADAPVQHNYDPKTPPVPLGDLDKIDVKGMKIGYYLDDDFFTPAISCQRATQRVIDILKAKGAELVPFPAHFQLDILRVFVGISSSDGMKTIKKLLKGETLGASAKALFKVGRLPTLIKRTGPHILPRLGEHRIAELSKASLKKSVHQYWEVTGMRNQLQKEIFDFWKQEGIQALVCPATACPAVPIGMGHDFSAVIGYTARFNVLSSPAGVLPVSKVRKEETTHRKDPKDRLERRAVEIEAQSEGLPVAAQIVSLPWQDHVVLKLMQVVEKELRKYDDFPITPATPKELKEENKQIEIEQIEA